MQIGAQLYTCHQRTTTLEDFSATLKKVADIGYRSVQVSGTCPYEPEWLRDELAKNNLVCALTHIAPDRIVNETEAVVKQHAVFGCKHIGIGGMPLEMRGTLEGYNEFKKLYLPAAEKMRDLGAKLLYHNHWFEFDKLEGKDVIERILEDFPEDSVDFTLDLGWAAFAGKDVLELIDMRMSNTNAVNVETLTLSGSSFSTMSQKAAYDVGCAVQKIAKMNGKLSLDIQAEKELRSFFVFHVEF